MLQKLIFAIAWGGASFVSFASLPEGAVAGRIHPYDMVGACPSLLKIQRLISKIAVTDLPVVIHGETGTGKELVARALHAASGRKGAFIAINVATIPEALADAQLFGYEKGAFTGASARAQGYFERAENGTLFLDEMGEMPISLQAKLLRVLDDSEYFRVGGTEPLKPSARIVCATHRNLAAEVGAGRFREDLFYRLMHLELKLAPLRERGDDIPLLVEHFLAPWRKGAKTGLRFSDEAGEELRKHSWPGNIRELHNVVESSAALSDSDVIGIRELQLLGFRTVTASLEEHPLLDQLRSALKNRSVSQLQGMQGAIEKETIRVALEQTQGNQVKAAILLGASRGWLRARIEEYGMRAP
jgi:two-component system nitrogen regulation response regulator GlnG